MQFSDTPITNDVTTKVNSDDLAMLSYMPSRDDFEKVIMIHVIF